MTNQIVATTSDITKGVMDNALKSYIYAEGIKGCNSIICQQHPIDIEPEYRPFSLTNFLSGMPEDRNHIIARKYERDSEKLSFIRLWCSKEDDFNWKSFEDVIKCFSTIRNIISFEILGNNEKIYCQLAVEEEDIFLVKNVITSRFPRTRFSNSKEDILTETLEESGQALLSFHEYYPSPPYWQNLTCSEEFGGSPLDIIYVCLNELKKDEIGLFQVIFIPTKREHGWHKNFDILIDLEYKAKYENSSASSRAFFYQLPSNYLPKVSKYEIMKAHPDKPFFAAILRIAVFGNNKGRISSMLNSLNAFIGNFRYGAKPFNVLTIEDYRKAMIDDEKILSMFLQRACYRNGMILNSAELSGLVNLPSKQILENRKYKVCRADKFEVPVNLTKCCGKGAIAIGINICAGKELPVYLPKAVRQLHFMLIGKTGRGKSTTLENMIWQDIIAEE